MHLNTDPAPARGKPRLRDFHRLTTTLLPAALVALVPQPKPARRCQEIAATHPHYREQTPLVMRLEAQRRHLAAARCW